MSTAPDDVWRRGDVLWRSTLDGVLVRRPATGDRASDDEPQVVRLTGTGVALWHALATPVTHAELCARLAADHGVDADTVASDLATVLDDLVGRGVVVGEEHPHG